MGPLLLMGISQIRGYEPGDAEWGVKLDHVRGQAEAKEDIRRVVTLWQSGEVFESAGGKRERGLLFLGAPGTGKTMMAKAIATGFNSPFVSIPGSGFAQTFIGIDAIIVRFLARKAKKLARKWGGQCIVFIDEIDAVGMRRQSLGGGNRSTMSTVRSREFFGPLRRDQPERRPDLRERGLARLDVRAARARARLALPAVRAARSATSSTRAIFPGMGGMGGGLALNQLLVVDGRDRQPAVLAPRLHQQASTRSSTRSSSCRAGSAAHSLRLPPPRPTGAQIYFIGATNVPVENLDPALTRPGRMGRHVTFRTPTKEDRMDIFDLYLGKVAHDPDLDTPARRDEIARITNGYSPAMIDQICSMALTNAHHEGQAGFTWKHLVDAMTVIESGTAVNVNYTEAGRARRRDPRGRSRRRGARLPPRARVEPALDQDARRLARPPPVLREGGALRRLPEHAVRRPDPRRRRDGRRVRLLRRELPAASAATSGRPPGPPAMMVGAAGMSPLPIDLHGKTFADETRGADARADPASASRTSASACSTAPRRRRDDRDPIAAVLGDPRKRAFAAQFIGAGLRRPPTT